MRFDDQQLDALDGMAISNWPLDAFLKSMGVKEWLDLMTQTLCADLKGFYDSRLSDDMREKRPKLFNAHLDQSLLLFRGFVHARIADRLTPAPDVLATDDKAKESESQVAAPATTDVDGEWLLRFDGAGATLFKASRPVVWTCSHHDPSRSSTNNMEEYTALLLRAFRYCVKALLARVERVTLHHIDRQANGLRKLTDEEYEEACGMVERLEATLAAKIEDATDWETSRGYITGLPYTFYDKL
ncbi:hypothetical protein PC117_g21376 [Phytophthora cactorum]|uniref:Uncharacterized protein n=1 Tax=Phytophthora cactorum TaxID=29920 RepID=A0A8T1BJ35_9STRA|nr:hypothetical protein PC117_g21376 [Phytophthora cactorum]